MRDAETLRKDVGGMRGEHAEMRAVRAGRRMIQKCGGEFDEGKREAEEWNVDAMHRKPAMSLGGVGGYSRWEEERTAKGRGTMLALGRLVFGSCSRSCSCLGERRMMSIDERTSVLLLGPKYAFEHGLSIFPSALYRLPPSRTLQFPQFWNELPSFVGLSPRIDQVDFHFFGHKIRAKFTRWVTGYPSTQTPSWLLIPVEFSDIDDGTIIVQIEDTQLHGGLGSCLSGTQKEVSAMHRHRKDVSLSSGSRLN
ncbi:hypothetical protein B0H13DRAFT_1906494 [Mycena leptocephala]|nr:hypothetical protein B0H13DRAFT_2433596 [Mycena leptocephala]KAJ7849011.1 hypothetical protein B0H13DRAFT_1906494 [Mycena leptocephala]